MNRNTERLAQHNGNEPEHRKISTTETSPNTTKLAHHNGNKMQHNKISTSQRKQNATQQNLQKHLFQQKYMIKFILPHYFISLSDLKLAEC